MSFPLAKRISFHVPVFRTEAVTAPPGDRIRFAGVGIQPNGLNEDFFEGVTRWGVYSASIGSHTLYVTMNTSTTTFAQHIMPGQALYMGIPSYSSGIQDPRVDNRDVELQVPAWEWARIIESVVVEPEPDNPDYIRIGITFTQALPRRNDFDRLPGPEIIQGVSLASLEGVSMIQDFYQVTSPGRIDTDGFRQVNFALPDLGDSFVSEDVGSARLTFEKTAEISTADTSVGTVFSPRANIVTGIMDTDFPLRSFNLPLIFEYDSERWQVFAANQLTPTTWSVSIARAIGREIPELNGININDYIATHVEGEFADPGIRPPNVHINPIVDNRWIVGEEYELSATATDPNDFTPIELAWDQPAGPYVEWLTARNLDSVRVKAPYFIDKDTTHLSIRVTGTNTRGTSDSNTVEYGIESIPSFPVQMPGTILQNFFIFTGGQGADIFLPVLERGDNSAVYSVLPSGAPPIGSHGDVFRFLHNPDIPVEEAGPYPDGWYNSNIPVQPRRVINADPPQPPFPRTGVEQMGESVLSRGGGAIDYVPGVSGAIFELGELRATLENGSRVAIPITVMVRVPGIPDRGEGPLNFIAPPEFSISNRVPLTLDLSSYAFGGTPPYNYFIAYENTYYRLLPALNAPFHLDLFNLTLNQYTGVLSGTPRFPGRFFGRDLNNQYVRLRFMVVDNEGSWVWVMTRARLRTS